MSKIVFFVFGLFIYLSLILFPTPTYAAVDSCKTSGIDYAPSYFKENSESVEITFNILNPNTVAQLKDKEIALRYGVGIWPWQVYTTNPPEVVNGDKFKITIDDPTIKGAGHHSGALLWKVSPSSDFVEYCSEVFFTVGVPSLQCFIDEDFPKLIPPIVKTDVRFLGRANKKFRLFWIKFGTGGGSGQLGEATTDNFGQGVFRDVIIQKPSGDKFSLQVLEPTEGGDKCNLDGIEVSNAAPPIPPPKNPYLAGPVLPTDIKDGKLQNCNSEASCIKGGGQSCNLKDGLPLKVTSEKIIKNGTITNLNYFDQKGDPVLNADVGVLTAVGCVPTQPDRLINSIMKYATYTLGGLALILMFLASWQWITALGNPDGINKARDQFVNAFIGLLFIIFSGLLLQIIGVDILDIPGLS